MTAPSETRTSRASPGRTSPTLETTRPDASSAIEYPRAMTARGDSASSRPAETARRRFGSASRPRRPSARRRRAVSSSAARRGGHRCAAAEREPPGGVRACDAAGGDHAGKRRDQAVVCKVETLPARLDDGAHGVRQGRARRQDLEHPAARGHRAPQGLGEPPALAAERGQKLGRGRRDRLRGGGGGARPPVGNHVADCRVGFVADPGDDRHAARRNRPSEAFVVEGHQVLVRTAAADEQDRVGTGGLGDAQGLDHARRRRRPLDGHRAVLQLDQRVSAAQRPCDVVFHLAVRGRDDDHALAELRDRKLAGGVHEPLGRKLAREARHALA